MIEWLSAGFDMGVFFGGVLVGLVVVVGACVGIGYVAMLGVVMVLMKVGLIK